jgi:hypothetical protein
MIIFMVIGKTSSSISKTEIFEKYSEIEVLCAVFPEITEIPCKISSPFRVDNHPSFSIYMNDNKHICFKDFGDTNCRGSLLDLLCMKWKCNFNQVFDKILDTMQKEDSVQGDSVTLKPKNIKVFTRKESSELQKVEVVVRPWRQKDLDYWASYGITKPWLKYAEVYPISYKIITKKEKETGKTSRYIFPTDDLAFCFVERKEGNLQLKIYQPMNTKGYKWCSKMDASVISLWTKVPEYGDRIIICSSLKDALCISCNLHIPAIAPQGEGYNISETACNELKRRYKQVFICFDTDKPGLADAKNLSEKTGFPFVVPDLKGQKDVSDYYKSLEDKQQFRELEKLFH